MDNTMIRKLLADITPGEWKYNDTLERVYSQYYGQARHVCELDNALMASNRTNGEFIAAAPTMIAWLLAENERLIRVTNTTGTVDATEDA